MATTVKTFNIPANSTITVYNVLSFDVKITGGATYKINDGGTIGVNSLIASQTPIPVVTITNLSAVNSLHCTICYID